MQRSKAALLWAKVLVKKNVVGQRLKPEQQRNYLDVLCTRFPVTDTAVPGIRQLQGVTGEPNRSSWTNYFDGVLHESKPSKQLKSAQPVYALWIRTNFIQNRITTP